MYASNIWHKLYIYGRKISLIALICGASQALFAQNHHEHKTAHLVNYDDKLVHYGFFLGGHSSHFRMRYAEEYLTIPNLHSIVTVPAAGFNLGFIINLKLAQYLDFRTTPMVGLHQFTLNYNAIGSGRDSINVATKEAFYAGIPLLFKYKSQRRDNHRVYLIGGFTPTFEVSSFQDDELADQLLLRRFDVRYEVGFGIDIYFPLFKFSPEIRYSHGLLDMLRPIDNSYSRPLDRLTMHSISIYLQFQ
jgi:hypothetical protein